MTEEEPKLEISYRRIVSTILPIVFIVTHFLFYG